MITKLVKCLITVIALSFVCYAHAAFVSVSDSFDNMISLSTTSGPVSDENSDVLFLESFGSSLGTLTKVSINIEYSILGAAQSTAEASGSGIFLHDSSLDASMTQVGGLLAGELLPQLSDLDSAQFADSVPAGTISTFDLAVGQTKTFNIEITNIDDLQIFVDVGTIFLTSDYAATLDLTASNIVFGGASAAGSVQYSAQMDVTYEFTPVPVPAAVWLFGSGLIGLIGIARRKKFND